MMRRLVVRGDVVVLTTMLAVGSACAGLTPRQSRAPLASAEGEVFLYLQPWPQEAARLSFTLTSISAVRSDGAAFPLEVAIASLPGPGASSQRLLATGRVPPGAYRALEILPGKAELVGPDGPAQLAIAKEPQPMRASFDVAGARATVLNLLLRVDASIQPGYVFAPQFTARVPALPTPTLNGVCSNTDTNDVTFFDKRRHDVFAVLPTGREPYGVALGGTPLRLYVAVSGEDQVAVQDLTSFQPLPPIRLTPGDRPRDLALSPDGRVLLVINRGSNSASFLDTSSGSEMTRVATGYLPTSLLVDRAWRRAYVLNEQSSTITVIDVGSRAVVGTVATDTAPLQAQLNRAGNRLYVIHAASPQMYVYSLPDLTIVNRVMVGLGASALKIDPRSDFIYVASRFQPRIDVYDSFSLIPIDWFPIPGPAAWLTIDDTENALLALVPSRQLVTAIDLASRSQAGTIPVGEGSYAVTVSGERF